jgi:uncharacterized RDD family membrane protein YckC
VQQLRAAPATQFAGLGWRTLAALIDTFAIGGIFVAILGILQAAGIAHLETYRGGNPLKVNVPLWSYFALYGLLFLYYTAFELAKGTSPGKMALGMRVVAADGGGVSAQAVVVRNLIRIPEAFIYYLPSAIACLASPKRQRLGDMAARTVVVRSTATQAPPGSRSAVPPSSGAGSWSPPGGAPQVTPWTTELGLEEALDKLKAAALGVRGAHHNYLRLSDREIERGGGVSAAFSPEYAAAWHTLADAVMTLQHADTEAAAAATHAGTSLPQALATRPDLQYLCGELGPYFTAGSDEAVQEAYLVVARQEAAKH